MNANVMKRRSGARYSAVAQALHWVTAVLVLVAFIYGPGGSEQRVYSPARDFDRQIHETLGLSVLTLVAIRVAWRMVDVRPDPHRSRAGWASPRTSCELRSTCSSSQFRSPLL